MKNVAGQSKYQQVQNRLQTQLESYLRKTGDPRVTGGKILWDTTMYYQPRDFMPAPGQEAIRKLGLQDQYNYFD